MKLNIDIESGNEGVLDPMLVADLVSGVADRIRSGAVEGKILDINGNTVGSFSYEGQRSLEESIRTGDGKPDGWGESEDTIYRIM